MKPECGFFMRLVAALEPWLDKVVIVGGWAHGLYRLHPYAQELDYPPLMTLDTDVAVLTGLAVKERDIRHRLLAEGFTEEFLGADRPPATHYHLGNQSYGFYEEFLTPLIGSVYGRHNKRKATAGIAGINSQQLRHIELLLNHPWSIPLDSNGFAGPVQIANPVSFLVQKVLIQDRREREDRTKDILYIHDTLEVFGSRLGKLRKEWQTNVAPQLHRRNLGTVSKTAMSLLGDISDDIRQAAQISAERALSPGAIMEACRYGFDHIFV